MATSQGPNNADFTRENVTDNISRLLAASIIADPVFPKRDTLPDPEPPPFSTHGHNLLLNYEWMVRRVWQVVSDVQTAIKDHKAKVRKARIIPLLVASAAVILLSIWHIRLVFLFIALGLLIFIILTVVAIRRIKPLAKRVAEIRGEATRNLLLHGP